MLFRKEPNCANNTVNDCKRFKQALLIQSVTQRGVRKHVTVMAIRKALIRKKVF